MKTIQTITYQHLEDLLSSYVPADEARRFLVEEQRKLLILHRSHYTDINSDNLLQLVRMHVSLVEVRDAMMRVQDVREAVEGACTYGKETYVSFGLSEDEGAYLLVRVLPAPDVDGMVWFQWAVMRTV